MMEDTPHFPSSAAPVPDELLDRYLLGRVTVEERRIVEDDMCSVPGFAEWVSAVRAAKSPREGAIQIARLRSRIRDEAGVTKAGILSVRAESREGRARNRGAWTRWGRGGRLDRSGSRTLRRFGMIVGMAALVVVMFVLGHRDTSTGAGVTRVYTTTAGQRALITLDDSTRVTLAPHTTLRLVRFGLASRTVTLETGEAYFAVVHAEGVPFIVQSGAVKAQVLGTEFLVQHNPGETRVHIAVASGKVRMTTRARAGSGVTLTSRQIGDVTDSTVQVSSTDDVAAGTEWAPGHLLFRNMPVPIILQTISRWYGYQFRYADPELAKQRLTIGVSTQSSTEALATLEQVLLVNLAVAGDTVTLTPQSARPKHGISRAPRYDVWTPTREAGR